VFHPKHRLPLVRWVGAFVFLGVILAAPVGRAAEPSASRRETAPATEAIHPPLRQPLIVGATTDSFSNSFLDSRGELQGFSVDLLDALARVMNLKIQRTALSSREIHERFRQGEFDLLQAYSESASRAAFADFSVPYLTLQGAVFVRRHNSPVKKLADLDGKVFAIVGVASIGEDFLRNRGLKCRIVYTNSFVECLRLVESGDADATFGSRLTVLSVIDRERFNNITQLEAAFSDVDVRHCFAVHKGDSLLLARLNEGLAILHRNGDFDRIYRKWFGRYDAPVFTSSQVVKYAAAAFGIAFLLAFWGLLRQRALRKRVAGQAEQLAEKEELLRALYENIPMAMCVIEAAPDGHRVIALNPRAGQLFDLAIDATLGRRLDELRFTPEWSSHLADALRRWPTGGIILHEEHTLASNRRVVVLTLVPLAPSGKGCARVCVLTEDITERRRFDEELAQTRKLRAVGELVGGIAHEFNNLLTPIMLKTSELQLDRGQDTKLQLDINVIARAVQRAAELTRRLLTFGRKTETRSEAVGLAAVVAGSFDLLRPTMDRRIVWENAVPGNLPPLFFNSTDLNQILVNLLLNARDTLEDKLSAHPAADWIPHIRVDAVHLPPETAQLPRRQQMDRQPIGWQRLSVRDNGLGITPAARERIFEPFYTTKAVGRGTGLGLATVWHLTTEAGGRVEVESTTGEGTVFHVLLPVWPVPKTIVKAAIVTGTTGVNVARVLVVEDEELVALTIVAALKRSGHYVHHIADGADGWEHLAPNPGAYDLLMLDVNLPGIDGIEFARRARAANYPGRILISSGRLTAPQLQAIGQLHVDRVLPKPFNLAEFQQAVRDCLAVRENNAQPAQKS
jgi:two-component system, cell cycle sensor histidine kinase and response regulator CckA